MSLSKRGLAGIGLVVGALSLSGGAASARAKHKAAAEAPPPAPASDKSVDTPPDDGGNQGGLHLVPKEGPATIPLGHDLTLALPAGYLFLDKDQANRLMESMGNLRSDDRVGIVSQKGASWMISMTYVEEGYVKDDEAEKLDADAILKALQEGTEEANKFRQEKGFPAVHVVGWMEPPRYDRSVHHVVWAVRGSSSAGESVNYNTRILGRRGYASLNLIDDPANIGASKDEAARFLLATAFNSGARYQDFDEKKDKVAEYGLAALIAGGAGVAALKLVKVGLLAKFAGKIIALLIAAKKLIVLGVLAVGAFLRKLFNRTKAAPPAAPAPPPPAAPPPAP